MARNNRQPVIIVRQVRQLRHVRRVKLLESILRERPAGTGQDYDDDDDEDDDDEGDDALL